MPWYYFNDDNSLCYISQEGKLADSEFDKLKVGQKTMTEIYLEEHPPIPEGREDEYDDLWILDDGSIGLKEEVVRFGTKRHLRQVIDFLQMYAPLDDIDRPADWDERLGIAYTFLGEDIVSEFLGDNIISNDEKRQLYEKAEAL